MKKRKMLTRFLLGEIDPYLARLGLTILPTNIEPPESSKSLEKVKHSHRDVSLLRKKTLFVKSRIFIVKK